MPNFTDLTTGQLNQIISIKEKIETLQGQLDSIAGNGEVPVPLASTKHAKKKRRMSIAARARIAAAQKARWAKIKGTKAAAKVTKKRRKVSAATKAKIAAAARARWAKVKAAGKKAL